MKTKLLFRTIQNCKNAIFTILIIFFMTVTSFSQSDGISFNCDGAVISFSGGPVENEKFNEYSYWNNGTGGGISFFLLVQEVNGNYRWEVHEVNPTGTFPTNIGTLWFSSTEFNVASPPCDPGSWLVEYDLLASFCYEEDDNGIPIGTLTSVTCEGGPIVVCDDADDDGFTTCDGDCDDTNATVNPGASEVCDGIDNNCDGQTDEGLPFNIYYVDGDADGYGDPSSSLTDCSQPAGYVLANDEEIDCDDLQYDVNPGASEICDGIDNDCDEEIDEGIVNCIEGVIVDYCDDQNKKILICHNGKTKCVSINAMEAHLAHGDYLGTCGANSKEAEDIAEEVPTSYDMVSWPNPTRDLFNIRMSTPNTTDKVSLRAFDINGRLIHSNLINGNEDYQFGSQFNSGIYFVILSQADKTEVVKLIKQ